MVKFLINRPVAVFMTTFAFLLLGIVASFQIPTSLMPDIPIPEITVQLQYPNNTARELETNVVRPLKNQLLQVSNLKNIESQTRDGFALIKLQFNYGTNTDYAFIETNEKIDASLNYLPKDIDRPKAIKASTTDIPVLNLTITLKEDFSDERFLELSDFTQTVIKKRIEQLPDIALADISGHTKPEIIITPYQNKITSLGITNEQLIEAIQQNNFKLGNLLVQNGIYQYNFKFSNPLKTKEDIQNIYLNLHNKLFQLKQLAQVTIKPQQDKGQVYYNGKRAIVLSVIKQANARVYNLKESLKNLTNEFKKDYPNLQFNTNQDQTQLLKISIDNLKTSLLIGSALAILIMFFFIRDIKSPLIIAISIPVSLITAIFFMYVFGLSINIISLSGLILGVGMMIDNAIIVIDNINQKIKLGYNLENACVEGTNEIITPLLSSVLTTCSVFLPLLFLSGITGALFFDQAVAVSIGLGASLLVSVFLIPVLFKQFNKNFSLEKWTTTNLKSQNIENWYEKGYKLFFKKKWIVYSISIVSIILSVVLFLTMDYSQLPVIDKNKTVLKLDWNENITVQENQNRIRLILENSTEAETVFTQVGEQDFLLQSDDIKGFSEASVFIQTKTIPELNTLKSKIKNNIKLKFPNANFSFNDPKTIFEYIFNNDQNKLVAKIYSKTSIEVPNEDNLTELATLLKNQDVSQIPLKQTLYIQIIPEKLALYNIAYDNLINELKTAFNQNFIDHIKTAKKFIPIKLNYDIKSFENTINNLLVTNKNGSQIAIKNVINIKTEQQYKTIFAGRGGEYLKVAINLTDASVYETMNTIQKKFINNPKFKIQFSGTWLSIQELNKELVWVILVAVLLLYFIMAAQFESLWQPVIILLEIPIDIGGALLLLWLFGGTINIMAAIGIVVMSGVIINDSILKIHTINLLRKQGLTVENAVKQGGKIRLKPILMTSLTTILALLPFLFLKGLGAELQKPLSLTVIGGMIIGTFISLYFIPLMYSLITKK